MANPNSLQGVQDALQRVMEQNSGQEDMADALRKMSLAIGSAARTMSEKSQASAADQAAMRDMLQQLSASAADIVALMEADQGREDTKTPAQKTAEDQAEAQIKAQALAAALGPVLAGLKFPTPSVNVDVQPAAVPALQPKIDVTFQPPADKAGQKWRIEIERAGNGVLAPISSLTVTRL